jgi:nudix-type nucleoside diphosphatase (YffH/AdpP family)
MSRRVEVRNQRCVFDDFFKVNELTVAHERPDGSMSPEQRRLVFERGDSVAVLLLNRKAGHVVLVDQFRAPTLGKGLNGGWVTEAMAGMIGQYETRENAATREALEETGYAIKMGDLKPLATFFSSPGGSSERIHLYYAEVSDSDKRGDGGGDGDEDIHVRTMPLDELFDQLRSRTIEDPKLLIAALSLQQELNSAREETRAQARRPLAYSARPRKLKERPDLLIGYKTGPINGVRDASLWVNSENEDMIMDRFIGRSISANIRWLGAIKDDQDNVIEDVINNELRRKIGNKAPARIGTVFETESGALESTHGVRAVFHVATVKGGGAGAGFRADLEDLAMCVRTVLVRAHDRNLRFRPTSLIFGKKNCESILFPMLGAGDGGLRIEAVVPRLFEAAVNFYHEHLTTTTVKEIYFLAFTGEHKSACDAALDELHRRGVIL